MKQKKQWITQLNVLGLALMLGGMLLPGAETFASVIIVRTTNDELNSDNQCSLREAIKAANTNSQVSGCSAGTSSFADIIRVDSGETYKLTRDSNNNDEDTDDSNSQGDLDITQSVRIETTSTGRAVINAGILWKERLLEIIGSGTTVTFVRIEFRNGNVQGLGGGGVAANSGTNVTFSGSIVAENNSKGNGGGIFNKGIMSIVNSTVSNNKTSRAEGGGGVYNDTGATLTVTNGVISNNQTDGEDNFNIRQGGGGIFNNGGVLTITNSTISGNNLRGPDDEGGGILSIGASSTTIAQSSILNNNTGTIRALTAEQAGGGVSLEGRISIDHTLIAGNETYGLGSSKGGGAFLSGFAENMVITNSIIRDNKAHRGDGGGLAIDVQSIENAIILIQNTTISGNQATGGVIGGGDGGGMNYRDPGIGTLALVNVTVSGNKADKSGGGLFASGSHSSGVKMTNVTMTGNDANNDHLGSDAAGGLFSDFEFGVLLRNSIIASNTVAGVSSSSSDCSGQILTEPINIIQSTLDCFPFGGRDSLQVNPKLNALANNGGSTVGDDGSSETIKTHSLQSTSPAIEAANGASSALNCLDHNMRLLNFDGRGSGFLRPLDGNGDDVARCDLGAFELGAVGIGVLSPQNGSSNVGEPVMFDLSWDSPTRRRDLNTVDLRFERGKEIILWLRFTEELPNSTFSLLDKHGNVIDIGNAGDAKPLKNKFGSLDLASSGFTTSGPDDPRVVLRYAVNFKKAALGDLKIQLLATDDFANEQGPEPGGSWLVIKCNPTKTKEKSECNNL